MRTDKDFFQRFPIGAIIGIIIGILLLTLSFDFIGHFRILRDFVFIIEFLKNAIGIIILSYFSFEVLVYFIKFSSAKKFEKNLSEIRSAFLENVTKNGNTLIGDFISFRPWMEDEFYVKSKKGIPNIFFPTYLVAFTIKDKILYITEAKAMIQEKTYSISGYHVIPTKLISSSSFFQDRILFSSKLGETSATNYFIEIRTLSGTIKIPLFEEEILSKYGNVSQMKEEFITKIMMITRVLNKSSDNNA